MGNSGSTNALQDLANQQAQNQVTKAFADELKFALEAVVTASKVAQAVFKKLIADDVQNKKDNSPVTVADYSVQAVICHLLKQSFPNDPVVAEESAKDLRAPAQQELKSKVIELTNSVLPSGLSEEEVLSAIDRGVSGLSPSGRFWVLDPIDGTKGFLRGEQFAICLALVENGEVVVGVLGCPNLLLEAGNTSGKTGCILSAVKGKGASIRNIEGEEEKPIHVAEAGDPKNAVVCESVEAAHTSHGDAQEIASVLGITSTPVRMDSQAKYAAIARGEASIYLRLPTSATYEEKVWDHAAGYLIVKEAGGEVTDIHGVPLDFTQGRTLKKNSGVIATNKKLHARVLGAVEWVLFPPVQKFKVTIKRHVPTASALQNHVATACGIDKSLVHVEEDNSASAPSSTSSSSSPSSPASSSSSHSPSSTTASLTSTPTAPPATSS